jgi:TPP-dependent pyruvate/acetoin dehydrogenase alpha subunit
MLEKVIYDRKLFDKNQISLISEEIKNEVEDAMAFAVKSKYPDPADLLKYVYHE